MKKLLITICLILFPIIAYASAPVLFFSDLIDGPRTGWNGSATKGAAVTIWGMNFGATRGAGYLTVAGQTLNSAGDFAEWGVTTNNARAMERITFWLNSSCSTGAQTISVTTSGGTSNTLAFYVRTTGNIRFVDFTNGNDSYDGTHDTHGSGSVGPRKTIPSARGLISGGDILYIRSGTYTAEDTAGKLYLDSAQNGAANACTAFVGYPGEYPVLGSANPGIRNNYTNIAYIVCSKIKILPTGSGVRTNSVTTGRIRFIAIEVDGQSTYPTGTTMGACFDIGDSSYITLYGCWGHHWGYDKYDHGIYFGSDGNYDDNYEDIGWCQFNDLGDDISGIYIHPQDGGPKYADFNNIHDNLCFNLTHAGIHISSYIKGINCWNNIIYNCGSIANDRAGVYFNCWQTAQQSNIKFYNNTVYSGVGTALIQLGGGQTSRDNVTFRNNIFYSASGVAYFLQDSETGTSTSNYDSYYGNGAKPAWAGANCLSNVNPLLTNAASHDFTLTSSSPCIGVGTDLSAILTTDYLGLLRGAAFDIGAYEYTSGGGAQVKYVLVRNL